MFENVELAQQILSPLFQKLQFIATCRKRDIYSKPLEILLLLFLINLKFLPKQLHIFLI
jgi:hypothetical protein